LVDGKGELEKVLGAVDVVVLEAADAEVEVYGPRDVNY